MITIIGMLAFARPGTPCSNSSASLPAAECAGWQQLHNSTHGEVWSTCSEHWNDPCACVRVACKSGRITELRLDNNHLSGTLPALDAFTALTDLYLFQNSLTGALPDVSALQSLRVLLLFGNYLSGDLRQDLVTASALVQLDVSCNKFTGLVPQLPFAQYVDGCFIGGPRLPSCPHPYSPNEFDCPLPADTPAACSASCAPSSAPTPLPNVQGRRLASPPRTQPT
jgi:hypothetical protein